MFETAYRLASPTGADLSVRAQAAEGDARGVLIVCHGLSEHSLRYRRLAEAMGARGMAVYALDHRGHGLTRGPNHLLGRFAEKGGMDAALDDVAALRAHAAERHPGLPVILFGHSMGGLIALNAVERYPDLFDAVTIWNSNFNAGLAGRGGQLLLAIERWLKGSDVPSAWVPPLTFGAWARAIDNPRTPSDWLSRDPAEVDAYLADPLCGFDPTVSLWMDVFRMIYQAAEPERLKRLRASLPILLVGGGKDPATDGGKAISWLADRMRKAGLNHVYVRLYPEARHETLNDLDRDRATQDLAQWIDTVLDQDQASRSRRGD
ncbi:lysophospholipase [Xaviernesmea oryzae]|uniref:Lysophospholipase n=1 Tax=Xaviernesmea oryzae TaxID=464029 RepID=A0A1Q9B063_9HYPH|nr:alpha/beta hydrolase [Xaviernesmea oryzae]OLP61363.1 lysophospholipase [Xaviernesmea oryzae]SEL53101.1 Lysophospholipase, alpha-beta hydrolase superfamily [Xaviernesmea oryzae]